MLAITSALRTVIATNGPGAEHARRYLTLPIADGTAASLLGALVTACNAPSPHAAALREEFERVAVVGDIFGDSHGDMFHDDCDALSIGSTVGAMCVALLVRADMLQAECGGAPEIMELARVQCRVWMFG